VGKMFEGQDQFGDYPSWTKTVDQINEQVRMQRHFVIQRGVCCMGRAGAQQLCLREVQFAAQQPLAMLTLKMTDAPIFLTVCV